MSIISDKDILLVSPGNDLGKDVSITLLSSEFELPLPSISDEIGDVVPNTKPDTREMMVPNSSTNFLIKDLVHHRTPIQEFCAFVHKSYVH